MSENKTHGEIIEEMRFHGQLNIDAEQDKPEFGVLTVEGKIIKSYADQLEAAHKRELIEVATRAATQGVKLTNEKYANMPIGNSAALREALKSAELGLFRWLSGSISRDEHRELVATIKAALAAPPRNCDRFGGDIDKLREACARERGLNPEEDFPDVFPDWLLAPAQEGGAK